MQTLAPKLFSVILQCLIYVTETAFPLCACPLALCPLPIRSPPNVQQINMTCPEHVHDDQSIPRPDWKKRLFARFMAAWGPKADHRLHDRKQQLFSTVSRDLGIKDVIEVGVGSGPNFKYYASSVDSIVGVDFNAAMQPHALASAVEAGLTGSKLQLVVGRAEALPLPDGCADAVIATHLMCSVEDVPRALSEFLRVLRPGGKYFFLEHVAAPPVAHPRLHSAQHFLTPVSVALADGCHMNRDTLGSIRAAGFGSVEAEEFMVPVPLMVRVLAPHVVGVATK